MRHPYYEAPGDRHATTRRWVSHIIECRAGNIVRAIEVWRDDLAEAVAEARAEFLAVVGKPATSAQAL